MVSETCSGDLTRNSCILSVAEAGEYDAVAALRMILSSLSILGTLAIIILAIGRRQVFHSKIHPIFVLSVADFILACLWIIGGSFWLRRPIANNIGCLVVSLLTVITQCITINLTLIYAILAYYALKKAKVTDLATQSLLNKDADNDLAIEKVWRTSVTLGVYAIAWVAPVIIVMITFAIVVGSSSDIITKADKCSCWCLPTYGNVLPAAYSRDKPTATYMRSIGKLIAAYGSVISIHYLVVFIFLIILYRKILRHINQLRQDYEQTHRTYRYGVTTVAIINSQSNAKTRVLLFLLVFIVNGFFNFLLSFGLLFYEVYVIHHRPPATYSTPEQVLNSTPHIAFIVLLMFQSLTLPLQGFLNTIVYGWTRKDFLDSMALLSPQDLQDNHGDKVENASEQQYHHNPAARKQSAATSSQSSLLHSRTKTHTARVYTKNGKVVDSIQTTDENDNLTDTDM